MRLESVLCPEQLKEVVGPEVVADVGEDGDPDGRFDPKPLPQREAPVGLSRAQKGEDDAGGCHGDSHEEIAPFVAALGSGSCVCVCA